MIAPLLQPKYSSDNALDDFYHIKSNILRPGEKKYKGKASKEKFQRCFNKRNMYAECNFEENQYIGCLNIHGIHVNANKSSTNNVVFFFVSNLKIVYHNPWS